MAGEKILIVEDERDVAKLMAAVVRDSGYETAVAYDGAQGLQMALEGQPDLILLDLCLPQMGGMQILRNLRKHQVNIPVVVVTAWGSEELVVESLRLGVKDYVKKPFALTELLEVAERALTEERLRRERDALTEQLMISSQEQERRVRQLTALYEVGQALASTLDLDELLSIILREASRVLEVSIASILLLDEQSGELVFRSVTGEKSEVLVGRRLAPGQGIAGWVAEHGEPLLIRQPQSDPRFSPIFDEATGFVTESILCVPLMVKGHVIGVVEALNKPQAGFTDEDLAMLRSLAASAAVSIENARLFEEVHRLHRQSGGD
jgi:DNA-binding response OmpR family regulator